MTDEPTKHANDMNALFEAHYGTIKKIAANQLATLSGHPEVTPTVLINECYLKLVNFQSDNALEDRQFYGLAARSMRFYLVDLVRSQYRLKNQGQLTSSKLSQISDEASKEVELLDLDQALKQLESLDPALGELVELRFFSGLSLDQIADLNGSNKSAVYKQWLVAKSMLQNLIADYYGPE